MGGRAGLMGRLGSPRGCISVRTNPTQGFICIDTSRVCPPPPPPPRIFIIYKTIKHILQLLFWLHSIHLLICHGNTTHVTGHVCSQTMAIVGVV